MRSRRVAVLALGAALLLATACSEGGGDGGDGGDGGEPAPVEVGKPPIDRIPEGSSGSFVTAKDGEIEECRGWGYADSDRRVPADCETAYDVMSMTKQFTAAAILRLQLDGELDVTDPIVRYFPDAPPDKGAITLQQLLTHTSGLVDSVGGDYEPLSRRQLVAAAMRSELLSEPGTTHRYSNVGYSLLAAVVEIASGTGYEQYLSRALFEPAGMTDTGYVLPDWSEGQVAVEYDVRGSAQGRPDEHPWAEDGPYWNLRGNGGLISTARDMYRWHVALLDDTVLDARSREQLFEPRVREAAGSEAFAAYGWVVQDTDVGRVYWHNGGNSWSYGEIVLVPDHAAMTFWVTNRAAGDDWNLERLSAVITRDLSEPLLDDS